jgi:hypothetical protein
MSTTTFLAAASNSAPVWSIWRPRQSRATRATRANEVAQIFQLAAGGPEGPERERARQFYLELRTLALLDDLRYNFRPRPVLRVRRHVLPPMVFVPRATRENGGIALLRVISDVRSRRSELDPLLVIAGLTRSDEAELHVRTVVASAFTDPGAEPDPTALYFAWVRDHLRVGQSPSVAASLPWVLPIRLPASLLDATGTLAHDASALGPPNWLRSAPRLLAGLVVIGMLTGAGVYVGKQPKNCDPDPLHAFDRDTEVDAGECYGISDGSVVFTPDRGVRLNGESHSDRGTGKGAGELDLTYLMKRIKAENEAARSKRHVVLFYVGELTAADTPGTALNGLRELAGVHAKQKALNARDGAGGVGQPKVVVEVANGGYLMKRQAKTVTRIIRYAREHPHEVLGVVGFSRDNESTHKSVERLGNEGLNVLAPQNSDNHLAKSHPNYFGLAATNHEQARAFQEAIAEKRVEADGTAVILTPPDNEDIYSRQQTRDAEEALTDAGLKVHKKSYKEVEAALCDWDPGVLYFTGRAEKLTELADALTASRCAPDKLALLTGDDLTKALATKGGEALPDYVTLYYASLAAPKYTLRYSQLPADIAKVLGVAKRPSPDDPLFEDGTMALAYDAATVLYEAALDARLEPAFINGRLLATTRNGAGGEIDLRPEHRGRQCGHTVAVFKVHKNARTAEEVFYRGLGGDEPAACPDDT